MIKLSAHQAVTSLFNGLRRVYAEINKGLNVRETQELLSVAMTETRDDLTAQVLQEAHLILNHLRWNNKKDVRETVITAMQKYIRALAENTAKAVEDNGYMLPTEHGDLRIKMYDDWCLQYMVGNKFVTMGAYKTADDMITDICDKLDPMDWRLAGLRAVEALRAEEAEKEREEQEAKAAAFAAEQEAERIEEEVTNPTPERKVVCELNEALDMGLTFEQRWEAADKLEFYSKQHYSMPEKWAEDLDRFRRAALQGVVLVIASTLLNGRSLRWALQACHDRAENIEPETKPEQQETQDVAEVQHEPLENDDTGSQISADSTDAWNVTHTLGTTVYYVALSAIIGYYWSGLESDAHVFTEATALDYVTGCEDSGSGNVEMIQVSGVQAEPTKPAPDMAATLVSMGYSKESAEILKDDALADFQLPIEEAKARVLECFRCAPTVETQEEIESRVSGANYWLLLRFMGTGFGDELAAAINAVMGQSRKCRTVKAIERWLPVLIDTPV